MADQFHAASYSEAEFLGDLQQSRCSHTKHKRRADRRAPPPIASKHGRLLFSSDRVQSFHHNAHRLIRTHYRWQRRHLLQIRFYVKTIKKISYHSFSIFFAELLDRTYLCELHRQNGADLVASSRNFRFHKSGPLQPLALREKLGENWLKIDQM
jgi:hypothetical protein